jgi:hypothetical protein
MEKNEPQNEEFRCFRAEAEELLTAKAHKNEPSGPGGRCVSAAQQNPHRPPRPGARSARALP